MDLTVVLLAVAAWIAVAGILAVLFGRIVRRAEHAREMRALVQEVRASDAARAVAPAPSISTGNEERRG